MKKLLATMVLFGTLLSSGGEIAYATVNQINPANATTRAATTFSFSSIPPKKYNFGGRSYTLNWYMYSNGCYIGYYS